MHYLPIFMDLRDQVAVLIGAGKVAERKARLLIQAGACVHVVAREVNAQFSQWIAAGRVLHVAHEYQAGLLHGARLVFVATGDAQLNSQVFTDAERVSVPVNVVDERTLCRFISPAVVDRSPIQVAISTGGSAPLLARRLRSWIETLLPPGLGHVASAAGDLRRFARERLPQSRRKELWEKLLGDGRLRSFSLQSRRDIGNSMRREIEKAAVAEQADSAQRGRVFLVGAGPGRADLLTLRALHVLAMADVILHDGLVSEEILKLARRDADLINVGKRAGKAHLAQQDIHACMLDEVSKGKNVVRLKGGDAFIFGRGGEELEYLRRHGVPYEVVPGITAALACAAYAGIPLTHRDYAQSLTLITGHLATGKESGPDADRPVTDWASIAGAGKTAAVYMGVQQAAGIRKALLQAGVDADLPVALVVNGSLDTQFVLHGRIENMAQMAVRAGSDSPGLLIIGQVAALGSSLNWFGESALLKSAA